MTSHDIPETASTDYMYKEKREEKDLPASKTALMQRFEDYIHEGGLFTAIRNDTDNTMNNRKTITRKQKWEKNNSMGVLND